MIGLFLRRSRARRHAPATCRLHLERLDDRIVPSAPTVSSLQGRIIGSNIIVYGTVQDDAPGTDDVTASGGVSGTYRTGTSGFFEFIGAYSGNGSVAINVHNDAGLDSQTSNIYLTPSAENQAPYITFQVAYGSQRAVTFTGTVYDESPANLTVSITGAATATATTDTQGHFSVSVSANSLGVVYATTQDSAGLDSNIAELTLTTQAPVISDLSCTCIYNHVYRLQGKVSDESPAGLTVHIGGDIADFRGLTATCDSNGWFSIMVTSMSTTSGEITVDVSDWWGVAAEQDTVPFLP